MLLLTIMTMEYKNIFKKSIWHLAWMVILDIFFTCLTMVYIEWI